MAMLQFITAFATKKPVMNMMFNYFIHKNCSEEKKVKGQLGDVLSFCMYTIFATVCSKTLMRKHV